MATVESLEAKINDLQTLVDNLQTIVDGFSTAYTSKAQWKQLDNIRTAEVNELKQEITDIKLSISALASRVTALE